MVLNGHNGIVMHLTQEEKIVIDAIRAGADATVTFGNSTFDEARERTDQLPKGILKKRRIVDLTDGRVSFISIRAENEDESIQLMHYVDVTKKATDGRQ